MNQRNPLARPGWSQTRHGPSSLWKRCLGETALDTFTLFLKGRLRSKRRWELQGKGFGFTDGKDPRPRVCHQKGEAVKSLPLQVGGMKAGLRVTGDFCSG